MATTLFRAIGQVIILLVPHVLFAEPSGNFQTVLITGAAGGTSRVAVLAFASQGYTINVTDSHTGFGQNGVREEPPIAPIRQQFEVSVFGFFQTTQLALPARCQRSNEYSLFLKKNLSAPFEGVADNADQILGQWKFKDESIMEIYKQDGKFFGKFIWHKEHKDWSGRVFVTNSFYNTDKDEYTGGKTTDLRNGREYRLKMWLSDPNTLLFRGYFGPIFQTVEYKRVK